MIAVGSAFVRDTLIKSSEFLADQETVAYLNLLSLGDANELIDELSEKESWAVMEGVLGVLVLSSPAVKSGKIHFRPKTKSITKWVNEPTVAMISAIVFHLETSEQHTKAFLKQFVESTAVMRTLAYGRNIVLLSRLLNVWLRTISKNKDTVPARLTSLEVFGRCQELDFFQIGTSEAYAGTLQFYPVSVWEAFRRNFSSSYAGVARKNSDRVAAAFFSDGPDRFAEEQEHDLDLGQQGRIQGAFLFDTDAMGDEMLSNVQGNQALDVDVEAGVEVEAGALHGNGVGFSYESRGRGFHITMESAERDFDTGFGENVGWQAQNAPIVLSPRVEYQPAQEREEARVAAEAAFETEKQARMAELIEREKQARVAEAAAIEREKQARITEAAAVVREHQARAAENAAIERERLLSCKLLQLAKEDALECAKIARDAGKELALCANMVRELVVVEPVRDVPMPAEASHRTPAAEPSSFRLPATLLVPEEEDESEDLEMEEMERELEMQRLLERQMEMAQNLKDETDRKKCRKGRKNVSSGRSENFSPLVAQESKSFRLESIAEFRDMEIEAARGKVIVKVVGGDVLNGSIGATMVKTAVLERSSPTGVCDLFPPCCSGSPFLIPARKPSDGQLEIETTALVYSGKASGKDSVKKKRKTKEAVFSFEDVDVNKRSFQAALDNMIESL